MKPRAKVLVSGCYDLLHAGHVRFFQTAAEYGDLYVCLGSDATVEALKGRPNVFNEQERLFIVQNLKPVFEARISRGSGLLDFEPEMLDIRPDFFVVNEDGASDAKRELCDSLSVAYVVLPRTPAQGLPARSSSAIKQQLNAPPPGI
ncbi:MAG: adenylyltransferase/cytidyltransferase family protein [Phycisphaerae bacterium]